MKGALRPIPPSWTHTSDKLSFHSRVIGTLKNLKLNTFYKSCKWALEGPFNI